jgi:hypothetical protein
MLFGKWRLTSGRLIEAVENWSKEGLDKRAVAERLIRYQSEALEWEFEFKQLCIEARRTFRREGLIPKTSAEWEKLLMELEPDSYFRMHVEPSWPSTSARRALAYMTVGMQILDETENVLNAE